jgi:hypothetical protein
VESVAALALISAQAYFYTHNRLDEWVEFNAKFTDGKLDEITKA